MRMIVFGAGQSERAGVGETRKYVVRRFIKTHLLLSEWNVIPDEVCLHLRVPSM